MAEFYNRDGQKVTLTINGFTDYEVTAININSCDISENIFCNIYTSALSASLLTSNKDIYTGSLVGKLVTLKIDDETRYYTIVTNVSDMDANYHKEVIEVEAIDVLTIFKNQRYEAHGFKKVKEILVDILEGCTILSAWGGTDIKDIKINIDALWEDEGKTAPLKYDVLQVLCEYCNRSLYYNYKEDMYVFFAVNSHSKSGVYITESEEVGIILDYHDTLYTINASTIATTDRRISLEDCWQSAELDCSFKDAEVREEEVTYSSDIDEGEITIYGDKKAKYVAYWGTSEGQRRYEDYYDGMYHNVTEIDSIDNQTIADTKTDADYKHIRPSDNRPEYHFGGRKIHIAAGEEDDTGDVEGYSATDEYFMFWQHKETVAGIHPSYVHTINTAQVVTPDLYLVIGGSVLFSSNPIPMDDGSVHFATSFSWMRKFRVYLTHADGYEYNFDVNAPLVKDSTQDVKLGSKYSIVNNVYWRHGVDTTGFIVPLCYNQYASNQGKVITKIKIEMYAGVAQKTTTAPSIISQYEFVTLDCKIAHSTTVNTDIISTDTIYKWVNDAEDAVICSGKQLSSTPLIVTFDKKLAGNNCAVYNNEYLDVLSDEMKYDGNTISSENRRINDMGAQYATHTFTESVTCKGILWFDRIFKDAYYNRKCVPTSLNINVVEATTNISLKELKQWQS